MTREQATAEARREAKANGVRMAVTRNRYRDEHESEWGYCPVLALAIFEYDEPVAYVSPAGEIEEVEGASA